MVLYPRPCTILDGTDSCRVGRQALPLEDEARQELGLPRIVCKYEDVFPKKLLELPPHRDVGFVI